MTTVTCQLGVSVDGFVAGPNQTLEEPLGEGGESIHEWMFATRAWHSAHGGDEGEDNTDSAVVESLFDGVGAYIMGRNMFGGGPGPWQGSWRGWWGDDPPYHVPVFVLTHHARDPLPMDGGTTFHFVTDGIESALAQARDAAGTQRIQIAGGAQTAQQYLRAGLLDELYLHIAPVVLGSGERLLDDVGQPELEQLEVIGSPTVTHIRYRVVRPG
jgi:dihydrofolate reductase